MHLKPDMPSSMLTKLLRAEKDYEREYRGGVRGGKDQFNWEDIRTMSYKDRECYLGYTSKIGFLDKGGKWRKRDWYKSVDRPGKKDISKLEEIKRADEERLQQALGLKKREDKPKDVAIPTLNHKQAEVFTKKIRGAEKDKEFGGSYGLGFKTNQNTLAAAKSKPLDFSKNLYKLDGMEGLSRPKIPDSFRKKA